MAEYKEHDGKARFVCTSCIYSPCFSESPVAEHCPNDITFTARIQWYEVSLVDKADIIARAKKRDELSAEIDKLVHFVGRKV